jgi:ATP synthase protein I
MAPSGDQGTWRALGELSSIGLVLVVSTIIGLVGGYYADRLLGTSPWLLLVGLVLGIVAGFVNLFRSVTRADRELDDTK